MAHILDKTAMVLSSRFQKCLSWRQSFAVSAFVHTVGLSSLRSIFVLWPLFLTAGCEEEVQRSNTSQKDAPSSHDIQQPSHELSTVREHSDLTGHRLRSSHLPNAIQIHAKVISGGQPDGEQGFRELSKLGVKTIISVDGAQPNVELARKYGFRYVHLPHGYNGISEERTKELALAIRELDGPIYIHCHHGKHRSPAAAAVACIANGLIDQNIALSVLSIAGTNKNYVGLFDSVGKAQKFDDTDFEAIQANFPEIASLPPLAGEMVALDHTFDRLRKFAANDWRAITDQPDRNLVHEVLLLKEHFTELLRLDSTTKQSTQYRKLLSDSESSSDELLKAIEQWSLSAVETAVPITVTHAFDLISANCMLCHQQYRDLPLGMSK